MTLINFSITVHCNMLLIFLINDKYKCPHSKIFIIYMLLLHNRITSHYIQLLHKMQPFQNPN